MKNKFTSIVSRTICFAILITTVFSSFIATAQTKATPKNIVIVHGAFADGSTWENVYTILTKKGYQVTMVQNPLSSLEDDVAATERALEKQNGPVVLVGHSWGGSVITQAGKSDKVASLVYVAAFVPEVG